MTWRTIGVTAFGLALAGVATTSPPVRAQQQASQPPQRQDKPVVAQQCLKDLATFQDKLREDGYWMAGWGTRWTPTAATARNPWGHPMRYGMDSPRYQIRAVYAAANVLGHRGDEKGCTMLMGELRDIYGRYSSELQKAGVKPGDVTSWRQERIVAAEPVGRLDQPLSVSELTGTEVRNAKDEWLGTVDDAVLDPRTGNIGFVVVERGGFLGMGEDHVVVPWKALRATQNFNALVLNVDENAMEKAPKVDPDHLGDPAFYQKQRQMADQYWQKQIPG